jgi:hypothetical protein
MPLRPKTARDSCHGRDSCQKGLPGSESARRYRREEGRGRRRRSQERGNPCRDPRHH